MTSFASSSNAAGTSNNAMANMRKKTKPKYGPLDLSNYIPLGAIRYDLPDTLDSPGSNPIEIDDKPSVYLPANHVLGRHLDSLYINGWIRVFVMRVEDHLMAVMRIFLIPDDTGRGSISREDKKARASLKAIVAAVDCSSSTWEGSDPSFSAIRHYEAVCSEQDSLFYIFNTLQSPRPDPSQVKDRHASIAMDDILEDAKDYLGLRTTLYDYQKRSAAMMIQREAHPALQLDSRLEVLHGPTGKQFFFDRIVSQVLSEKRCYEETRGGILAETMGHGKTLISLVVVLATKGHLPRVPLEYQSEMKPRSVDDSRVGAASLKEISGRAIYEHAVPWKSYFMDLAKRGEFPEVCQKYIEENPSWYSIPKSQRARRANSRPTEEKKIYLSSTTLIVVPPNLVGHWKEEISTHLEQGVVSVLVFQDDSQSLPSARDLLKADVILMSKTRFEDEMSPRKNNLIGKLGKSGTRQYTSLHSCCCSQRRRACPIHEYDSPLLGLHFLRFIVDEGHNFASSASTRATIGLRSIHVERKWIISGTPSKGLLGLEIDMATDETTAGKGKTSAEHQQEVLEKRKIRPLAELEAQDLAALGHTVTNFLGLQPWANSKSQEDSASWQVYLAPDTAGMRKAGNLRCVLESLVVRHQMNQVEKDLELPPLKNRVVYLDPCFLDQMSLNLFTLVLVSNAITSERTDQDYMFHPKNRPQLEQLIRNLRHSGFHWTGFSLNDISEPVRISRAYMEDPQRNLSPDDRLQLRKAVEIGEMALNTMSWRGFAGTKELGLYVDLFPEDHKQMWALCASNNRDPLLIGATYLADVQSRVNGNIYASNPFERLVRHDNQSPWQSHAVPITQKTSPISSPASKSAGKSQSMSNKAVPLSTVESTQKLTIREFRMHKAHSRAQEMETDSFTANDKAHNKAGLRSAFKSGDRIRQVPEAYAQVSRTRLVGTASAKLSYLLDRVMDLYKQEKILIFYDADYIAYYIAQALELLHVPHDIYATGLRVETRSKYLESFNKDQHTRVLLMDLKQAAHGLHVASASRVFFVNPVWSPSIEAQAIKRAHRIGQTRPVYVETLVLKGTIEEQMLQRRKAMTTSEHQKASKSLLDDVTMSDIIKDLDFHSLTYEQMLDEATQHAPLKVPQQIFGREFIGRPAAAADSNSLDDKGTVTPNTSSLGSWGKAKINLVDVLEKSSSHRSLRPETNVAEKDPAAIHNLAPALSPARHERRAVFEEAVEADRNPTIAGVEEPHPSATDARPSLAPKERTPAKSPAKDPRAVLMEAAAVANKWKEVFASQKPVDGSRTISFAGIPSPGPSSGEEGGKISKGAGASNKRRTDDQEPTSQPKAKTIRFAV